MSTVTVVTKDSLINENLKILKIVEKQKTSKNNQKYENQAKITHKIIVNLSFHLFYSFIFSFSSFSSS